ncbi:hypothetical protein ANANG_G00209070 [Anguilla anguilla]|uniref:Thyrotropin-releasing hormone receptor n=1 Tax=Anguilla anguilla TaxID=7936 RepID=A0A9D3LZF4_ANGAN|nr:hypothetical protein ANANG_G00209070 [Anguilla anguilla]
MCTPPKQTVCTVSRAKRIIAGVWALTCVYCLLWFFLVDIQVTADRRVQCGYRVSRDLYLPVYLIDFAIFYVLPLLLAIALYALIARALPQLAAPPLPLGQRHHAAPQLPGAVRRRRQGQPPRPPRSALSSRKQVTKMLAVVVVLFALLWMPYRTLVLVNSFVATPYLDAWFLLFCRTCIYANSAINPVVYNAMSQRFRSAFRSLYRCQAQAAHRRTPSALTVGHSVNHGPAANGREQPGGRVAAETDKRGKEQGDAGISDCWKKDTPTAGKDTPTDVEKDTPTAGEDTPTDAEKATPSTEEKKEEEMNHSSV